MESIVAVPHGCPAPVREALHAALESSGRGELCIDPSVLDDERKRAVVIVYCDSDEQWDALRSLSADEHITVAMIVELEIGPYARALASGASGVVHYDNPANIVTSVLLAAARGEVVLPVYAAQALGAAWTADTVPADLTEHERHLLRLLASGTRIAAVAEELSFSERTIRRQLQSVYLKLGVANRYDAIRVATRSRLV